MSGKSRVRFVFGLLPASVGNWPLSMETCPGCGQHLSRHPDMENVFGCRNISCLSVYGSFDGDSDRAAIIQSVFPSMS